MHLPANQTLHRLIEGFSSVPDHDVTAHMAVSTRQNRSACGTDLLIRQGSRR
jgi:hypothetical protein